MQTDESLSAVTRPLREGSAAEPLPSVHRCVERGREFLFSLQRKEGHWCAELESNVTITSEYVFLQQMLGLAVEDGKRAKLTAYLLGRQKADGGWGIANGAPADVSTTAEAYLALRLLGVSADDGRLKNAQAYILGQGGLARVRIFTRIFFAMFGLYPWHSIPAIPPEFILIPPQSPVNIYSLSSWARGTMVPLFVIFHHKPVFALPNGSTTENKWLDHLWIDPTNKIIPYSDDWLKILLAHGIGWKSLFGAADKGLKIYEPFRFGPIRKFAVKKCISWVLEHQESSGDWAGIFPPMINSVLALSLEGYGLESEPVKKGLQAIENFSWEDAEGLRIQACVSPVWDTALSLISLVDSNTESKKPEQDERLKKAVGWLNERQILENHGDWKVYRPDVPPGGWSFEYFNTWYPDVDDTAAVLLSLFKQDSDSVSMRPALIALEWCLGMQNRDGGWAAFDVNNDKLFLNEIPFSDMDSLCDPSSPDVTGRVLEAFGIYLKLIQERRSEASDKLEYRIRSACRRGLEYLRQNQEKQGSWFGRWGVNYVYGTSNVLCGLSQLGIPKNDPMVVNGLRWLESVQNEDGGWGESLASYDDKKCMGCGPSTASQTAWGLMGMLAYQKHDRSSVQRGVFWLVQHQVPAKGATALESGFPIPIARGSTWDEKEFTGTGFPRFFYLRYHLYRHYFPMMALGRYLRALADG